MADDEVVVAKKKRTLLEKYDIPIHHLSYEYVNNCNDGKELERIVKILRSGEEGLYPDLVKCAEKRLTEIMPDSKALRVEEPVLTKSMLSPEHWNQVSNELTEWSSEMKTKEQDLSTPGDSLVSTDVPGIRTDRATKSSKTDKQQKEGSKKVKSAAPRAFSEWDKFDADKEILKMDLEEEKKKEDIERKQRANEKDSRKKPHLSRSKVVGGAGDYSNVEKQFLAAQEKDKGNEYFKAREYKQAIEHYSASIAIDPSPVAYNNRAMAHLKLEEYAEALRDANKVLEEEPDNVKALHRRGMAHKHQGSYQSALNDFSRIVQLEPDNRTASSLVREMQFKMESKRKSVRMHIAEEDGSDDGPKIVELPDEPYVEEKCIQDSSVKFNTSWPPPPDRRVKCNEFGLPKMMCNCSGVPDWVRKPPPKCLICKEIKEERLRRQQQQQQQRELCGESTATNSLGSEGSDGEEEGVCEHLSAPEKVDVQHGAEIEDVARAQHPQGQVEKGGGDSASREEASVSNGAAGKSSTAPSPSRAKSARKMEGGRRSMPPETIKPVKVQVARKYTTKAIVKGEEEVAPTVNKVQGIQELSLQDSASKISTPFEFITAVQSVQKGADPSHFAPILQRVDPADLQTLIGNNLDDPLLSNILECLEMCFSTNGALVLRFLEKLSALPRFGIVVMFMDPRKKEVVGRLFEQLEKQGYQPSEHLRKAYVQ